MAVDYNSNFDVTTTFSDDCAQINLAQNTNLAYTVPGTQQAKYSVRFNYSSTSNVFVGYNQAINVPGANVARTDTYVEFKPGYEGSQRYAKGGDVINFMTPDAAGAYVGISLRKLPG